MYRAPQSPLGAYAQVPVIGHEVDNREKASVATPFFVPRKPVASETVIEPFSGDADLAPRSRRVACKLWALELLAAAVSVCSLAALITILALENGKLLTGWRFFFSLNTIVSILGTLSKLTLALCISACIGQLKWNFVQKRECEVEGFADFDAASRGPWGSCKLLLWLNIRHWASLGALVTIVSISIDPFLQATIRFQGRLAAVPSNSPSFESPALGHLDRLNMGTIELGPHSLAAINSPYDIYLEGFWTQADFRFLSAVFTGIDNSSARQDPATTCTTGNCTWPAFTSLAICNTCHDVSSEIVKSTWPLTQVNKANATDQVLGLDDKVSVVYQNGTFTNYSLPYSRLKSFDLRRSQFPQLNDVTLLSLNMTADYRETISFQDMDTMLVSFLVMRAGDGFVNSGALWNESAPTATECGLYFCVQEYQSASQNSEFRENITGTWAIREADSWKATYELNAGNGPNETVYDQWTADHPSLSHQYTSDRVFRTDLQLHIPASESLSGATERFNVSQITIASFQDFLLSWSIGQIWRYGDNIFTPDAPPFNSVAIFPYSSYQGAASKSFPILSMLWPSTNLSSTFDTFAATLTNKLRNSNTTSFGELQQWEIYVQVRWPFVAVPVLTTVVGLGFVAAVITQTARARLPVWKEDILPLLAYGLPGRAQKEMRASYRGSGSTGTDSYQYHDFVTDDDKSQNRHRRNPSWDRVGKTMMIGFDTKTGLQATKVTTTTTSSPQTVLESPPRGVTTMTSTMESMSASAISLSSSSLSPSTPRSFSKPFNYNNNNNPNWS